MFKFARFHALPGKEQSLAEALHAVVEPTRAEAGCREIHVFQSLRDPATFFIHSSWTDEQAFEMHAELPHVAAFLAKLPGLIDHELEAVRCARITSTRSPA
jgi:quinol monooxygenase YgiN